MMLLCSACNVDKDDAEFSKNQKSKGDSRRCKPCVALAQAALLNTTNNKRNNPGNNNVKNAKKAKQEPITCELCQVSKKPCEFPLDVFQAGSQAGTCGDAANTTATTRTTVAQVVIMCNRCLTDSKPRACRKCKALKPKDQYSFKQWQAGYARVQLSRWTRDRILATVTERCLPICLDCERQQQEELARLEKLREEKEQALRKKHNIHFYDFGMASKAEKGSLPKDLSGVYDILFHYGFCSGDAEESRTTKGTVVLKEAGIDNVELRRDEESGVTMRCVGVVEFHPDMARQSVPLTFQRDFRLFKETNDERGLHTSELYARLLDDDAVDDVHDCCDMEYGVGSLECIAKRAALAWMKYEDSESNEEEEDKVIFDSVHEAQELMNRYERGLKINRQGCKGEEWWFSKWWRKQQQIKKELPDGVAKNIYGFATNKPKPVFFLEPGDLILDMNWTEDIRESSCTCIILRKRE